MTPMSKRRIVIVSALSFGCLAIVVVGFGVWKITSRANKHQAVVAESTSSQPTSGDGATTLAVTNNSGLGGGTEVQSDTGQPVAQTKPAAATASNGPETFSTYEQYKDSKTTMFLDLKVGDGKELTAGKKAAVVYKVWLTNGKLVDESTVDKASGKLQAFVFTLGEHKVIPGWEQGVFGMKVNGQRRLIIPAALAYGAQGQGGVPPNSMLVIEVQLFQVE